MSDGPFVSRAGLKLDHALDAFGIEVAGLACADLGCNVGGFTDCLLVRGAASVVALDTGYGVLDWRLRNDPRVRVRERTNALHAEPSEPVALVVVDLGWTRQALALPAARRWLAPGGSIVTLVKPHYEASGAARAGLTRGRLDVAEAEAVVAGVIERLPELGFRSLGLVASPIVGGKGGNAEWLAHVIPAE